MDEHHVFVTEMFLQLAQSFHKGHRFDVTESTSKLNKFQAAPQKML